MEPLPRPRKATPKWFGKWIRPVAICAILVPGVPALVTLVPLPYHVSLGCSLPGLAGNTSNSSVYTAAGPGVLNFRWSSNTSDPWGNLSLYGWPSRTTTDGPVGNSSYLVYGQTGESGGGTVSLIAGFDYEFVFTGSWDQTVSITGDVSGSASILQLIEG